MRAARVTAQTLKKKPFQREKAVAQVRACAIFRADSHGATAAQRAHNH
ncbi:MAG TPA: hypothetical protein VN691_02195 [Steroidobacteraceae bacterium]|nr:hypothetical protein [Steroidobacteraceae bacterium]